jgi:CheY-like chemotaxis protein
MARILIVEDNPANLALMEYLLRAFGHTPLVAWDGEAGIAQAIAERPDLILLDLHMPKVDGFEAARRIREERSLDSVPVIAVTASAMVGDRDKILAQGFDGYIGKPITPETFVEQVERFLPPPEKAP